MSHVLQKFVFHAGDCKLEDVCILGLAERCQIALRL